MSCLFYRILLLGNEVHESAAFRKASNLPFPSPVGTSYQVPIAGLGLYYVIGHEHVVTPTGEIMNMHLSEFETKPEYHAHPPLYGHVIPVERERLLEDGWEEMDESDQPIKR